MKAAVVVPCGTVTVVGTAATRMSLVFSWTTCPPACAGPESVIVPVAFVPPVTCAGATVTLCSCPTPCGFTVNVALCEPTPPYITVMVTVRTAVTVKVAIVNVAVVSPDAMITVPGACAIELALELTVISAPEIGAAVPSVTVAVTLVPPVTELLESVSWIAGTTDTCMASVVLPSVAVRLAVWTVVTSEVGIGKVVVLLLTWTVTEAGGCTAASSLDN